MPVLLLFGLDGATAAAIFLSHAYSMVIAELTLSYILPLEPVTHIGTLKL